MADPTTLFDLYSALLAAGLLAMISAVVVAAIRFLGSASPIDRWRRYGILSSLFAVEISGVALGLHWLTVHRPSALAPMGAMELLTEHPAPGMVVVAGIVLWVYHRVG